jgi:hypothetical protein
LAREQPLGKDISDFYKKELGYFHEELCNFKSECLEAVEILEQYQIGEIKSFKDLIHSLNSLPKMSAEITEMLRVVSILYLQFAVKKDQKLANIDELSMFISRCLILWKLKVMKDSEFEDCLNSAKNKFTGSIDLEKFVEVLSLELQTYQFLQYGLSHDNIKLIANTFKRNFDA